MNVVAVIVKGAHYIPVTVGVGSLMAVAAPWTGCGRGSWVLVNGLMFTVPTIVVERGVC